MKIKKNYVLYLFCLLPFLEMPRFGYIPGINRLFLLWKLAVAVIVSIEVLTRRKLSRLDWLLIIYSTIIVISTYINDGEVIATISDGLAILVPVLLIEHNTPKCTVTQLIAPFIILFTLYATITAVQLIRVPFHIFFIHGLRDDYTHLYIDSYGPVFALGEAKRFVFILLPLVVYTFIYGETAKGDIIKKVIVGYVCAVSLFCLIYSWSVSAMLAMFCVMIYYLLYGRKIITKMFKAVNAKFAFVVFLIINYLLVRTNFLDATIGFVALFGKATTLSGRTYVWARALEYIKERPLIGWGVNDAETASCFWNLVHMHNLLVNCAYIGGVLLLACIVYILYMLQKRLSEQREPTRLTYVFNAAYIGFLILSLTDTPDNNMLYVLFMFIYVSNDFLKNNRKGNMRDAKNNDM